MKLVRDMTADEVARMLADTARVVANEWHRLACRDTHTPLHLWYREARNGECLAIPLVSADCPADGYRQSITFSLAWTKDLAQRRVNDAMRSLPILGL